MQTRLGVLSKIAKAYSLLFKEANPFNVTLHAHSNPIKTLETKYGPIKLSCENALTLWRANTFFSKEPDTLAWIDSMMPGDVFFDIGANVGIYSLYAARRGLKVFAFEPEAQNYAILNRNIHLNGMQELVSAFNLALGDRNSIDYIFLSRMEKGAALHNVGSPEDFSKKAFVPQFRQGVMVITLDELVHVFKLPQPSHIKIDVDGAEAAIISGARETITREHLSSLLVELNMDLSADQKIKSHLERAGFSHSLKYSITTQGDRFENIGNFIFYRTDCDQTLIKRA